MCSFQVGKFNSNVGIDAKKAAMEAAKAKALGSGVDPSASIVKYIPAGECSDRIRIVFDDSGSMGGQISNAKKGVVEFLKNCTPNQTAVAVHFMNTHEWNSILRSDLPQLGADVLESELRSGGTPFFNTLKKALDASPRLTRLVAFTDGSPTDYLRPDGEDLMTTWAQARSQDSWINSADIIIEIAKSQQPTIPIDTVFFGSAKYSVREQNLLKYLSEHTGGFFMCFDPQKMDFAKGFKYLAPVNRLRLTDGAFRAKIEKGEAQ